ncbi:MAG: cyclase family protein [Alicyclobacillaceae bacterium]|nr:cyclase family protein [Alicyclobacillaceae bacterium]
MTWIDVSQRLDAKIPVWPGDTPISHRLTWTKAQSSSVNVSQITMSTHTGIYIDAPFDFDKAGRQVLELDIDHYIGPARGMKCTRRTAPGRTISPPPISMRSTVSWSAPARGRTKVFPEQTPYLQPEFTAWLASTGVWLVGLDLPSVDPMDSKDLSAHYALARHSVQILEDLVLITSHRAITNWGAPPFLWRMRTAARCKRC